MSRIASVSRSRSLSNPAFTPMNARAAPIACEAIATPSTTA
jgi:hypothetical protein